MKKIWRWLHMSFISLFYGMKGADEMFINPSSDAEINHHIRLGNVNEDLLRGEETEKVQETRDATYRVLREADKYEVSVTGMAREGEENESSELRAVAVKKVSVDVPRIPVYETPKYKVTIVQDRKEFENDTPTQFEEAKNGTVIDGLDTLIFQVKYEGVIPRFHIERHVQKAVIKESKNGLVRLDLYVSQYARQFNKQDSLFIVEINKIYNKEVRNSDILSIEEFSFITSKAFGVEDLHRITLRNLDFKECVVFDGNFVLEFMCKKEDEDIVKKYRKKTLDEKYEKQLPKKETTDINAIVRKMDKEEEEEKNYNTTIFKL